MKLEEPKPQVKQSHIVLLRSNNEELDQLHRKLKRKQEITELKKHEIKLLLK